MPLRTLSPLAKTFKTFFGRDAAILREALKAIKPEELAVVVNNLSEGEQLQVLTLLEDEKLARVVWEVSPHARQKLLDKLGTERFMAVVAGLESDEAVDLIQLLDRRRKDRVVEALRKSDPKRILPLLGFEEETAGGLMKTEFLRAESGKAVEDVRKTLATSTSLQKSATVYVADAAGVMIGTVSLVRLATAPAGTLVDDLMQRTSESLPVSMPQDEVIHRFSDLDAFELPVVGPGGKLMGVITADDMFDVIKETLSEDFSRFSGTSEDEHITDPAWLSIRRRLPWLLVNLATAVLASWVVTQFQDTIVKIVVLAALMPLVAGMGGNAVTQTLGVVIRALALDHMQHWALWKISLRQTFVGAFNGFATGLVIAVLAYAWTGSLGIPLVLIAAMVINLLVAGAGGVLIPVAMKKMRIDPALASTVFATTLTDCVGFFTFLGLAKVFLT
ncbi:MAG TPA: magnesium transporter [Patescibacteria group bacterium]|nr:magnesium transporter [Patescibacteria group bacterium]